MKNEIWSYPNISRKTLFSWCDYWNLSPMETKFLLTRNLIDDSQMRAFFSEDESQFSDPLQWDELDRGAKRILQGLQESESIVIYGDYDVDGIAGTAILIEGLRRLGYTDLEYYIPHRQEEGYGLNQNALEELQKRGVTLLVTVDCGTASTELVSWCQEAGMDVIITDHHLPGETLPPAYALVNPQCVRNISVSPLAGAGVALKLLHGIYINAGEDTQKISDLLGWCALATVADMVELKGENRWIVKKGLEELRKTRSIGLESLLEVSGISKETVDEKDLGFSLGPRLNASGRLETAKLGVELFLTSSREESRQIAQELNEINDERRRVERQILEEAREMLSHQSEDRAGIVLYKEDWHPGVVGIVASRLAKEFWKPTLLLCGDGEELKGSGRSIPNVNLYGLLTQSEEWLIQYGGHQQAAGVRLRKEQLESFRQAFFEAIRNTVKREDLVPKRFFDQTLSLEEVDLSLNERVSNLKPFGMGNRSPKYVFSHLEIISLRVMGKENQHLKIGLRSGQKQSEAILWNRGADKNGLAVGDFIHGIGEIIVNRWNGQEKIEFLWEDFSLQKNPPLQAEEVTLEIPKLSISYRNDSKDFANFYRFIYSLNRLFRLMSVEQVGLLWKKELESFSWSEFDFYLTVFEELGFIQKITEELIQFQLPIGEKTSLEKSKTYQESRKKNDKATLGE